MTRAFTAAVRRLGTIGPGRTAALLVVVQLTTLTIAGWAAPLLGPREPFRANWDDLVVTSGDFLGQAVSRLQRWDALWYQHIAQVGYNPQDGSAAFQPLYPVLGWLVSRPLFGNVALGLVVVSCVAYGIALWLLGRLAVLDGPALVRGAATSPEAARERTTTVAVLAMVSLAAFPTAFFFVAPFTESLFLLLAVATLWFARTGRPWAAALTAALATLTRTQGVFLALPIAWEALRRAGYLGHGGHPGEPGPRPAKAVAGVAAAAVPVLALLAWYGWQVALLDPGRAGPAAQAPWGYRVALPWDALVASVTYIADRVPGPMGLVEGLNLLCFLAFVGLAVAGRRLPASHTLYVAPALVLYGARVMWFLPLMSVSRYVLVLFPGFIVLGALLERRPRAAVAWLVVSAVAQVVLFQYWVRWGFVA